eukprot:m.7711 g.7711  ORF g.7711 m.7711 type:complete len:101 (+) comp2891_c0_seq1:218-520(+)
MPPKGKVTQVLIVFTAAAGAPQLKDEKRRVRVNGSQELRTVINYLKKLLKEEGSSIFVYTNQLSPSIDEKIGQLSELYGSKSSEGKLRLNLHYSLTPTWG